MTNNRKQIALFGLVLLAIIFLPSHIPAQVPSGFSTAPIFDEEFNETSLNTKIWSYRHEGEMHRSCYFDSSAIEVANGYARIHIYTKTDDQGAKKNYCGALSTQSGGFLHTYGYWEANVRFQYRPGMQCSFWMQSPTNGVIVNNPQQSGVEMDVFEHIQSAGRNEYDHALWWNSFSPYETGKAHIGSQSNLDDGNFHRFGLAWTPGKLTFYVDGAPTWDLSASDVAISDAVDYIILDTELTSPKGVPIEGYGPLGTPSNATMDVDYVRVYPYNTKTVSTTLYDIADTYVEDGPSADSNFSSEKKLRVARNLTGANRASYLKFDLSKITVPILKATLYLSPLSVSGNKVATVAQNIPDNSWEPDTITWNKKLGTSTLLSTGINYGAGILTNFDVTAAATSAKQFTVLITQDPQSEDGAFVEYASQKDEVATNRPRLVIITADR